MHLRTFTLLAIATLAACKGDKADDKPAAEKGGDGKPTEPAAAGGFEARPLEFEWTTWDDSRRMKFAIQANLPAGWKLMTEGDNVKMLQTFMPAGTDPKGTALWSTSSVTWSATCHGSCVAKDIPAQVAQVAKSRAGAGGKILLDAERAPGVHAFVIEQETYEQDKKQYNVGVSHYHPDWDSVVFCEAMLFGAEGKRYEEFVEACATTKLEVIDLVVGADRAKQEEANLAKCPAASTLTYTSTEPKPDDPVFDRVGAVHARASQVGSVSVMLASVPLTGDEFRDKALEPGQGVVELWLGLAGDTVPDVLSGMYTRASDAVLTVAVNVRVTGGTSYPISFETGGVEVIARTRKKICGRIDVADQWRSLKGEFVADLVGR